MIDEPNVVCRVMIAPNIAAVRRIFLIADHHSVDGEKTPRGQQLQSGMLEFLRALAL